MKKADDVAARWTKLGELTPARRNPRKNDKAVDPVARSIATLGFGAPIVIDQRGEVIAGHTRLAASHALRKLWADLDQGTRDVWSDDAKRVAVLGEVPVRTVQVTTEQAAAMRIADNKLGEIAEWDPELLEVELKALEPELVEVAGFEVIDVGAHERIEGLPSGDEDEDIDESHKPSEPVCRPGDVWELGRHLVVCGDTGKAETLAAILSSPVDCVITDPPYAIYGSSTGVASDVADDKMVVPFFEMVFRAASAHVKKFGHVYTFCDWRSWSAVWEGAKRAHLAPKNLLVWDKNGSGLGSNYANTYELIGFFSKQPMRTQMRASAESGQRSVHKSNVLRHPRASGDDRVHNASKPVPLVRELVVNSTDEGERVLDLFLGGGSTLIACEREGRACVGVEIDPGWVDVVVRRWEALTGEKAKRR